MAALMAAASVAAAAQGPAVASPEAEGRVESILGRMTLEEKIDLLGGVDEIGRASCRERVYSSV